MSNTNPKPLSPIRKLLTKNKKQKQKIVITDNNDGSVARVPEIDIDSDLDDEKSDNGSSYLPPSLRVPDNYSPTHSPTRAIQSPSLSFTVEEELDEDDDDDDSDTDGCTTEIVINEDVFLDLEPEIEEPIGDSDSGTKNIDPHYSELMVEHATGGVGPTIGTEEDDKEEPVPAEKVNIGIEIPVDCNAGEAIEDENDNGIMNEIDSQGERSVKSQAENVTENTITGIGNKEDIVVGADSISTTPRKDAISLHEYGDELKKDESSKENIPLLAESLPLSPHSSPSRETLSPVSSPGRRAEWAPPHQGILRAPSMDRMLSRSNSTGSDKMNTINISKKAVTFADENGGIISEQQTIDVSPSKLSRRVRRGNKGPSAYENEDEDIVQKGVMGRVLVLLMDPPTKQYELTSVPFPLVSNENGVVGPTKLSELLRLVAKSASFEPLRNITYLAFMRPEDSEAMDNDQTILDHKFVKDEVLIAIPEGYDVDACGKFSYPILKDKRLVRLLKKLKKHERKAEKKRRLKSRGGMKPNRSGSSSSDSAGNNSLHSNGSGSSKIQDRNERDHGIKWPAILFSVAVILIFVSLLAGSASVLEQKKINESIQVKSMRDAEKLCGRGVFCKPFGVKPDENRDHALMTKLRDGIRKWNLDGDDLML